MASMNYQYGTSPRKIEPEYKRKKVKKTKVDPIKQQNIQAKLKLEKKKKQRQIAMVAIVFLIMLTISYRNSLINERFNGIQKQKEQLATIEKTNGQLEVDIESSLNLSNIEESAKSMLGMQKLSNDQKVFIELPKKDYVETVASEIEPEPEKGFVEKILEKIFK